MAGRSAVTASEEQKAAHGTLAASKDRGEADRARAILLTLKGWTSAQLAEVFCVSADTVHFWPVDEIGCLPVTPVAAICSSNSSMPAMKRVP